MICLPNPRVAVGVTILSVMFSCGVPKVGIPNDNDGRCIEEYKENHCKTMDFDVDESGDIEVKPGPGNSDDGDVTNGNGRNDPPPNPKPSTGNEGNDRGSPLFDKVGSDLSKSFKRLADFTSKTFGEISGKNEKKRREAEKQAKEIQAKIDTAIDNYRKVLEYEESINTNFQDIDLKRKNIQGKNYLSDHDAQEIINRMGRRHNKDLEEINDKIPDLKTPIEEPENGSKNDDCLLKLKPCNDLSPQDEQVITNREYIDYARDQISTFEPERRRLSEPLLDLADDVTDEAEKEFQNGNLITGEDLIETGRVLVDLALGFNPATSFAHDLYQVITGSNFITGEELSKTERTIAALGLVSGGVISSLSRLGKVGKVMGRLAKKRPHRLDGDKVAETVDHAEDMYRKGFDKDTLEVIRDNSGCHFAYVEQKANIMLALISFFENQAYASDLRDCGSIIDEILESAKKSAAEFEADISKLPPGERVAQVKGVSAIKASQNGWSKNNQLKKRNNRDIYTDKNGTHWGVDTQHGHWEKFNKKTGKHEGAYNMDGEFIEASIVSGRKINL